MTGCAKAATNIKFGRKDYVNLMAQNFDFPFVVIEFPLTFATLILIYMIAVVKIAGQQYKVEKDQSLYVPHVEGNAGDKVALEVLMVDKDGKISVGADVTTQVNAEIVNHIKGDKVIAYKQKRRKGFRKKLGHRTLYTQILIKDIK
jgi:large subunit ribosomal protein L21